MVAEAFPKRPLADVEARVGELMCTSAFNLYGRRCASLACWAPPCWALPPAIKHLLAVDASTCVLARSAANAHIVPSIRNASQQASLLQCSSRQGHFGQKGSVD